LGTRSHVAGTADLDRVTECISLAFATDPVWAVALGRPDGLTDHHLAYWRLFVEGASRYGTVFMTDGGEAVSVWLPPDGTELTDRLSVQLDRLLDESLTPGGAAAMRQLYERFEASRAAQPTHAYLSLLATHPAQRGRGVGQALLAGDLERWDAAGVPAYLESTNPANNHRYERAGFRSVGGFAAVIDGAWVTAMWRPARHGD
jgi:ribosomal protein S18 acetylase RimI-like enzyme